MAELKRKFAELCGYTPNTGNRTFLVKRILWRIQSLEERTLSERAVRRAAELANERSWTRASAGRSTWRGG